MLFSMVLCLSTAHAEDSTFVGAAPPTEEVSKTETHVTGELGGSIASGNSNFYTLNGLVNASHKFSKNQLSLTSGLNIGGAKPLPVTATTTGGATESIPPAEPDKYVENVRRLYADGRYDRFLSDKDSLYVLAGIFHDKYAGYDFRSHEQIGYSRLLLKNDTSELKSEFGIDLAQEDYIEGTDPNYQNIVAGRVLLGASHNFNDKVSISDVFEAYENVIDFEDLRILNTASVTSSLSGKLSLKLSHSLIFDNVPVEGLKSLDQTTLVTLVASLL